MTSPAPHTKQSNLLIFLGLTLFLLGLIVGLFVQNMTNPRMALSAHLEGVMNGMFLILLGLIWKKIMLSARWLTITFWLVLFGTYANITAVLIAAATGFGKMMPIAGGQAGTGFWEGAISFLLITLALAMVAAGVLVLFGFYKYMHRPESSPSATISA
ncbi:MAG: hydrogenase [Candidatus Marinimicrobia bacterium]|nr:hydrogenase [Candidatus Neomarinimicrobiota bacterium]MCF7840249.1 hydrogenase [Candidatus Neomarinimicrobiota bacterium]